MNVPRPCPGGEAAPGDPDAWSEPPPISWQISCPMRFQIMFNSQNRPRAIYHAWYQSRHAASHAYRQPILARAIPPPRLSFAWSFRALLPCILPCGFSRYTLHTSGFLPKHPPSSLLSLSSFPALDSRMRDGQVQDLVLLATAAAAIVRGIDARDGVVLQS